jgi:hypothetical protein
MLRGLAQQKSNVGWPRKLLHGLSVKVWAELNKKLAKIFTKQHGPRQKWGLTMGWAILSLSAMGA